MKKLIIVNGAAGSGKSAVCQRLYPMLERSVYLDGDWCWTMHPFVVNPENIAMVENNIAYLLRSFLGNTGYDYVLLSWGISQSEILQELLDALEGYGFTPQHFLLEVTAAELAARLRAQGREEEAIAAAQERLPLYQNLPGERIATDGRSPEAVAREICEKVAEPC